MELASDWLIANLGTVMINISSFQYQKQNSPELFRFFFGTFDSCI